MLAALGAVNKGVPVKRAALDHGVPRSTLQDRHLGKVNHGTKPGPAAHLTGSEEAELSEVLGQIGYRKQIKGIAKSVAHDKGVLKGGPYSNAPCGPYQYLTLALPQECQLCLGLYKPR